VSFGVEPAKLLHDLLGRPAARAGSERVRKDAGENPHGLDGGRPPVADLATAARLHDLVRALVADRVVAAVHDWAVSSGFADPAACVVDGWSWGGYLTLLALGIQPQRWAAGRLRATARATGAVPICDLLSVEGRRFGRHTTRVVITASPRQDWVMSLLMLTQRGVKAAVVLLEASTFGASEGSLMVVSSLAAADIWTYLVKQGDDLSNSLAPSGEGMNAENASA